MTTRGNQALAQLARDIGNVAAVAARPSELSPETRLMISRLEAWRNTILDIQGDTGRVRASNDVDDERERQERKWGEQNHDPMTYLTVLMEEVGELAQCALHGRFGGPAAPNIRKEAVQVAAVALAIVECLDRGQWTWRDDVDERGNPR